ncbi:MAG: RIP metalloprotease RseP [Deltaproteobacteria bacterium]|nr:RIP metalloprotease RseP [Deltaproteobacteria bacterium]
MEIITGFFQDTGHILLYYILPFVVVLGIMIFFHELGHFLVAKYFNVKVLKFALGFGPKIVGKVMGETEYSIRWIPLGGFVKMLGEDTEEDEDAPRPSPQDEKRAFNNQHPLKRIAIVAAGPVFNLLLALFLFCGVYIVSGDLIRTAEVGNVVEDSPASRAGIIKGDIITSMDGKAVKSWDDLADILLSKAAQPLSITVQRQGEPVELTVTPEEATGTNEFGEEIKTVQIGIESTYNYVKVELSPLQAISQGAEETWMWIKLTCLVVVKLLEGVVSVKTLGGPIMIGQLTGQLAQEDISYLIPFMGIISINLGILNLFPIPILDGGLILFLIIELITGKPLSLRKREMAQKIGFSLLIALMILVFYNDILRMFQPTP